MESIEPRLITDHQVNPVNDLIRIEVLDDPGEGGANHEYRVVVNDSLPEHRRACRIFFHNGLIGVKGVNGITQEVLIAICIDRLRSFQAGPYACRENALALTKLEEAQMWLLSRTRARMARNVEGTHTV